MQHISRVVSCILYFSYGWMQDIWKHIHSLTPLWDAACVSRAFLSSWRQYPNLTLTLLSLGYFDFTKKVNNILKNHSGVGMKKLILEFVECYDCNDIINHLDSWLQIAVTPQIEELTLISPEWFPDDPEWQSRVVSRRRVFIHTEIQVPMFTFIKWKRKLNSVS